MNTLVFLWKNGSVEYERVLCPACLEEAKFEFALGKEGDMTVEGESSLTCDYCAEN